MQPRVISVVYRKFDGSLHWHHPARLLGEDEFGRWIGCEPGTTARRGTEPAVVWEHAIAMLIPRDAWWTATFNAEPDETEIYCDITTVPEWRGDEVTAVDLDLDVLRMRDGRVVLDDEDEFAEHQVRYAYPADVIAGAEMSAAWLLEAVRQRREPFGTAYEGWLRQVTGLPDLI
jgi:protein associated with RNAse G/E